ncbi:MAG: hypothetical protein QNJ57_06865 [Flavobacteriaceae bacterium]|nr:hypothetical protein [Flavobacteriaceae bacterium]
MPKDMRQIVKDAEQDQLELPKGHRERFEDRLALVPNHRQRSNFFFLKIAASLVLLVSLGYFAINSSFTGGVEQTSELPESQFSGLGGVSPEMQKVENYYLTAINYELASLEKTSENQKLLDDYLDKIGKLDEDYKRLNEELAEKGVNEKTIHALITNLQLRLQLLLQLKDQLNELQTRNDIKNEDSTI